MVTVTLTAARLSVHIAIVAAERISSSKPRFMVHGDNPDGQPMSAVPAGSKSVEDPRVYLAAERTFLAWIRTSISLMGFGFVIARFALFLREYGLVTSTNASVRPGFSSAVGFGMVCLGVAVCLMAAARHRVYIHALERGVENPPLKIRTSLAIAAVLALVGLAIAIHIIML